MAKKSTWTPNNGSVTPVIAFNSKGKQVKMFKQVSDAAQWVLDKGLSQAAVYSNCTGAISASTRTGAPAYGYTWVRK